MNTRKYETMFLVAAGLTDPEVQQIADRFKGVVETHGGKVESAGKWEKRKLAYMIGNHKEANYVLMNFESGTDAPAELKRQMRNSDDIIRHMILRLED